MPSDTPPEVLQLIRDVFHPEAGERLETLEQGLLQLEASPEDAGALDALLRAAHSLKGSAAMVGVQSVADITHAVEDVLQALRKGGRGVDAAGVSLLLEAVDALRGLHRASLEDVPELGAADHALIARLEGARAALAAGAPVRADEGALAAGGGGGAGGGALGDEPVGAPRTLRVGMDRLDKMLDLTGEMAVARGRLTAMLEGGTRYSAAELLEVHREADRLYMDLQEQVMRARMVPIERLFQPLTRTLRDLCTQTGKLARLELVGQDVEVDATVVELLRDPLTHMVRNAVDHGLETPEGRLAAGKDPAGRVTLRAVHEGGSVVVRVEDDGRGLDAGRIRERARAAGVTDVDALGEQELFGLIFRAGFSTAEAVTELSGRGVGMDVVQRNVEALRGQVRVESRPHEGTAITLRLPLTVSVIDGFGVGVGEETFVVPLEAVEECLELPPATGARAQAAPSGVLNLRGSPLPYVRLRAHFGLGGPAPARENVVVLSQGGMRAGLAVDALHGHSQTVIKPLSKLLHGTPGVSGSAILGTGRVALILDVPALLQQAVAAGAAA